MHTNPYTVHCHPSIYFMDTYLISKSQLKINVAYLCGLIWGTQSFLVELCLFGITILYKKNHCRISWVQYLTHFSTSWMMASLDLARWRDMRLTKRVSHMEASEWTNEGDVQKTGGLFFSSFTLIQNGSLIWLQKLCSLQCFSLGVSLHTSVASHSWIKVLVGNSLLVWEQSSLLLYVGIFSSLEVFM